MRPSVRALIVLAAFALTACSEDTNPIPSDDDPAAVTRLAGNNQSALVNTTVTILPTVKVTDNEGDAVFGATVTFAVTGGGGSVTLGTASTALDGTAKVGSWKLGPNPGTNTLTATVTGNDISGNPVTFTATGTVVGGGTVFAPTSNTSISGTQTYSSVAVPAGVIVTLSGDAILNVSGSVTNAGTILGNCVNLTMNVTGSLTSSGNIGNGCTGTVPATLPAMTIIAQGGYQLTGGTVTAAGALNISNDPALNDGVFAVAPFVVFSSATFGSSASSQPGVCSIANATFIAEPATRAAGSAGITGGPGVAGDPWILQCTGQLEMSGGNTIHGQNGGAGGAGTHTSATAASSTGGPGGKGGDIKVRSNNGNLVINGVSNNIISGNGGAGGAASATGTSGANPGASATALGGAGNAPGNILLQAKGGGVSIGGATLTVGSGGAGGSAIAIGAPGLNPLPCPVGAGGAATATGGAGGATPDKTLTATGTVVGAASVVVAGGIPGIGGAATATGGLGGNGVQTCKNGGNGGAPNARGGAGGNALLRDAAGALFANGANGGNAEDFGGVGGRGFMGCGVVLEAGGNGGSGAALAGTGGAAGTGKANGTAGTAKITNAGNGGNGGHGTGPGSGGSAGTSTMTAALAQNALIPGVPGTACTPSVAVSYASIPNSSGVVAAGTRTINLLNPLNSSVIGTMSYTTTGTTYVGSAPGRIGLGPSPAALVSFGLNTMVVNTVAGFRSAVANVCVVGGPVSGANPVTVRQRSVAGTVVQTNQILSQSCSDIPIWIDPLNPDALAAALELFGPENVDFIINFVNGYFPF